MLLGVQTNDNSLVNNNLYLSIHLFELQCIYLSDYLLLYA